MGCGCACDDIRLEPTGVADTPCELGRGWFARLFASGQSPEFAITDAENVREAAERLGRSRAPVVFGLTGSTVEAVREALALADLLRAKVVLDRTPGELGRIAAFQDQGRVSATLGEVRNRADLIVYWGVDPVRELPRHAERYGSGAFGRFVEGSRAVVTVGGGDHADFRVEPNDEVRTLAALRMVVKGRSRETGWAGLADRLTEARYGAVVFRPIGSGMERAGAAWEAATRLVRDLNDRTRSVLLSAGRAGNLTGAEAALTWQGGFLQGLDYARGYPEPLDPGLTIDDLLDRREVDLVLTVGAADPTRDWKGVPLIAIRPTADPTAAVGLAAAVTGLEVAGTVVRPDGVALPLRPVRASTRPTEADWLRLVRAECSRPGP